MSNDRWLLPEGIEELLPNEARCIEKLRRNLLDLFYTWGYDLVIPPFIEYLESLLTGVGNDLELQTFRLVDQRNGRMLGIRADMTPQVTRIDSHQLNREGPTRLCYLGTVLRTQADDFTNARSIMQLGAELYGHSGIESDVEILSLMLAAIKTAGVDDIFVDLGHVGIFHGLARQANLDNEQESVLFDLLQRKAAVELKEFLSSLAIDKQLNSMISELIWLNGDFEVIEQARKVLKSASVDVHQAIDDIETLATKISMLLPDTRLHFDMAEVRGIRYHTGIVFAVYTPGEGQSIAQGGRYDGIGKVFGRARPSTGFSADLRTLMRLSEQVVEKPSGILAPNLDDKSLHSKVTELRGSGERVIFELPGLEYDAPALMCDRALVKEHGEWVVNNVSEKNG